MLNMKEATSKVHFRKIVSSSAITGSKINVYCEFIQCATSVYVRVIYLIVFQTEVPHFIIGFLKPPRRD